MKKKLLVCIAFHYTVDRIDYLVKVVSEFLSYKMDVHIYIDTNAENSYSFDKNVKYFHHKNLSHPFHLTWCHREHIKREIDNYDYFMYIEDDMLLPFENFVRYVDNFEILYPKYVPSFVRIEKKNNQYFISDIPKKQQLEVLNIGGKQFHAFLFPYNYHAFWIMPAKELKESMKDNFVQFTDGREFAAMYVGWELGKPALVEIENGQISKKCYSYHLPNNYALGDGPNAKIKPEDIFI